MDIFILKKIAGLAAFMTGIYMVFRTGENTEWLLGGGIAGAVGWQLMFSDGFKFKTGQAKAKTDPRDKFFNNLSFMGAAGIFVITMAIWAVISL